jgi:hypothetical protein
MGRNQLHRYTFNEDGRIYTDHDELWLPSVSTVLDVREKPPALRKYLRNTSEEDQKQKTFYTQNRGTLIHWYLQKQLDPDLEWTDDEEHSEQCLKGKREHESTGLTGDYETWQRFKQDREWAMGAWKMMRDVYGIHPENTLDVELFVMNTDIGYAGQFDLLYADDGDVVLADIKTSKRVYDKHLLQLTAYSYAVDVVVDRMEVLRLNPDGETWEVSRSDEWIESRSDLYAEFCELRERLADDEITRLKDKVET